MNRYDDRPQPNEWIMRGILTALQPLELDDFDQREGDFYFDADDNPLGDPNCPVCVGLRIAFDCELARTYDDGGSESHYGDGHSYVALAAAMTLLELDELLHKHGVPSAPFGSAAWDRRPFDVFKDAFEERLSEAIDLD